MFRRIFIVAAAAVTILSVSTAPALAISSIKNSLSVSSSGKYVSSGERTYWTAKTSYGQWLVKNPYTSDFKCLVNARHFGAPRTYQSNGTSSYWRYVSYDSAVKGPAWRNHSGTLWVWQPRTVYNKFRATGLRSGYTKGWRANALGQHHWSVSKGSTARVYTYHY